MKKEITDISRIYNHKNRFTSRTVNYVAVSSLATYSPYGQVVFMNNVYHVNIQFWGVHNSRLTSSENHDIYNSAGI